MDKKTPTAHQITVNGLSTAFNKWSFQEAINPPVLLLHGWLDNAASFNLLAPLLKDVTLYALDLPGHGLSQHLPSYAHYHFIDGVSHIISLIEELEFQECILIGHSLGACIASMVAGIIKHKVSQLVLLDGIGPLTSDANQACENYRSYCKKYQTLINRRHRLYPSISDAAAARAQKGYLSLELAKVIVERGLEETPQGYRWRHDQKLLLPSPIRMTEAQVLPFLENITSPTCLISASKGFHYDIEKLNHRKDAVKHLEHHSLSCGHHLHLEEPRACAKIINKFLSTK